MADSTITDAIMRMRRVGDDLQDVEAKAAAGGLPVYIRDWGMDRGVHVRTHDGDRQLSPYEVQLLLGSRGQPRFDEEPVMTASLADLDPNMLARLLTRMRETRGDLLGQRPDDEILQMMGVITRTDDGIRPTLAGLLSLGSFPQAHVPQLNLSFVVYPTTDGRPDAEGRRFLDNQTIDGPIPHMLVAARDAITRHMTRRSLIVGLLREDQWEYPAVAVREAIANALVHRDLSPPSRGTQVRVEMFPNRIVISNPGGLHGPVTVADLGTEPVTSSRNARLARLLEDVVVAGGQGTVVENRGSGLLSLVDSLRRAGMEPPVVRDRVRDFSITMSNAALLDDAAVEWLGRQDLHEVSDLQRMALAFANRHGSVTNAQYRTLSGYGSAQATRDLSSLSSTGHLVRSGEGRGAAWLLTEDSGTSPSGTVDRTPTTPLATARQVVEILNAVSAEPKSAREIAEATDIGTRRAVLLWLNRMESEGLVAPTADKRKSPRNKWRATVPRR